MKKKTQLSEVRQLQKIAGLLKEDIGMFEVGKEGMPKGIVLQFLSDLGDIEEVKGTVAEVAKKITNHFRSSGYKDLKVSKIAQDLIAISAGGNMVYLLGPSGPNANEIYNLYQSNDIDSAFDAVEELAIPNTVEGWVDHLYSEANPKQKAKLISIYKHQMENEEATDAKDFFEDLIDSSDPEAIIDLDDLDQYSGY